MILQCANFQDLTRNDQGMIEIEWEISFMTANDQYSFFSFAIHKQLVARFSKTFSSYYSCSLFHSILFFCSQMAISVTLTP